MVNRVETYNQPRSYDDAIAWLRDHGFDILEAPGTQHRVFLKKNGCSAAIEKNDDSNVKIFATPGVLVGTEISKLVDRGFQKFLKTTKTEVPATAEKLKALHDFTEELREALGGMSFYNESLGTVSNAYLYDRVEGRDTPTAQKPERAWEAQERAAKKNSRKPA
jgi:hypothetical protein